MNRGFKRENTSIWDISYKPQCNACSEYGTHYDSPECMRNACDYLIRVSIAVDKGLACPIN